MTTQFGDASRTDDLYISIITRIEAKNLEGALALYNTVEDEAQKRGLLLLINRMIIQNLSVVRELARDIDRDLARDVDRDLIRSRELDRDLAIAIRLELDIALDLEIARELARGLARDIALAHQLAHAHDLTDIILRMSSAQRLNQFIIIALSGELTSRLVFEDLGTLTLPVLRDDLMPYLQALFDLEKLLVEAKGEEFLQPKIKSISQNSPVKVEITTIPKALALLLNVISPFWRQHERKKARSDLAEQKIKLAKEIFGEHAAPEQIERGVQIIDALNRKPPTLSE